MVSGNEVSNEKAGLKVTRLSDLADYEEGAIVSTSVVDKKAA